MNQQQLRDRTRAFAKAIVRLCHSLPPDWDVREVGKQLLRSGTSVAANYRAASHTTAKRNLATKKANKKKGRANGAARP